ncbi:MULTISPECIES: restriction endonuclease [unclassified Guyparkeria]|uniref:restriction endonuclease n=1 Tax=unclassified Guyparkeria TaxID=2626246 RepID=UPI0007336AF8|nr:MULTISPECIES: restriction endonuclease [unclassified Guyparkeria]KTG15996.1 restriction endonuclease [Guyparkeria sp. XI15]OAE84751.1 restriction endonuclease [Guyparkeria sp. WRN-7]
MTVPDFQTLFRPLLEYAEGAEERRLRDAHDALADTFGLSDEERQQMLPSGRAKLFYNRVAWAATHLKKAGLLEAKRRGVFAITDAGREAIKTGPERMTNRYLERYPTFVDFRYQKNNEPSETAEEATSSVSYDDEQTPEEGLELAWKTIRTNLEIELLDQIKQVTPDFFEQLVVDVLVAMGYGGERNDAARAVGKSGDGGIDGIIDEDPLGLDVIYLQAKRWEGVVGRPEIQKFAGALQGRRAKKGVFITTSSFTREALEYATLIDNRIILLDGRRLARLMIDHGVGVSTASIYELKKLDTDYFLDE